MIKEESYEKFDNHFSEVPLPDGEQSWQKMELLLKKEKDDRIIPPLLFRSCAPWAFLLLLLTGGAWFLWQANNKKNNQTPGIENQNLIKQKEEKNKSSEVYRPPLESQSSTGKQDEKNINTKNNIDQTVSGKSFKEIKKSEIDVALKDNQNNISRKKTAPKTLSVKSPTKKEEEFNRTVITTSGVLSEQKVLLRTERTSSDKFKDEKINKVPETELYKADSSKVNQQSKEGGEKLAVKDSIQTVQQKEKTGNKKNKKYFIALGLGEEQQLALNGQKAVAYSYYGRKSSLSDYIPSFFIRVQRETKWYVQGEFRYGAAQSVKELSYSRQTKLDASSMYLTTTTLRLKKTYYHQLPLSFNYFVLPDLSVGAGGIYSRFYGAVTEREVKSTNIQTQVETVSREIVPIQHFTDSFFYKTQVHLLFQADYHWKKFSFGLRYTKDVQPYIKYTKPDGIVNEEKNQSLLLTLRYRLWKSGKF